MDELVADLRRPRALAWLGALFVVSGATGLVYQTVWSRQLHHVFGTSTLAIATVLAAFMGGLAAGGALAAGRADSAVRPLRAYGLLEIGIGVFALVFPSLLHLAEPAWVATWQALPDAPLARAGVQLVLVGAMLVVPTAMMGATLPLLARFAVDGAELAGAAVGRLYAANTLGAVLGTWLAGFVLLPSLGLWTTTVAAATANVALGVAALVLDGTVAPLAPPASEPGPPPVDPRRRRAVLVVAALAGFASLVEEVAWTRVLTLMLGASVYAFSTMLLAFLVGIAVGGALGGPLADRALASDRVDGVLRRLALAQLGVAAGGLVLMHAYQELPFAYVWLFDALRAEDHPEALWAVGLLVAGGVMLAPAILMGVTFPLAVRAVVARPGEAGVGVGSVYAWNTLGGVFGAALAGFVLLPWLRVTGTVQLAAAAHGLGAAIAWFAQRGEGPSAPRDRRVGLALAGVATAVAILWPPAWNPLLMTAGMHTYAGDLSEPTRAAVRRFAVERFELVHYDEGWTSVVTVARNPATGNLWLANNGKVDASTSIDMPTQDLVSLLPFLYAPGREDVLVIGLASGITAGAVTLVDGVERLDVVEIEPAIVEAARFFDAHNHGVLDDPRVRLVLDDGRNHVLRTPPGTYDVIVSEPSNPWLTGVSNLFTREFFELGRSRLKPRGIWSQWVQLYSMDDDDVRSLVGTFASVWPHVLVYAAAEDADLVLIGSEGPLVPTFEAAEALLAEEPVREELARITHDTPARLTAAFLMDRDTLVRMADGYVPNTDDSMRIEYRAPLHLHADTQGVNARMLERHAQIPVDALAGDPDRLEALARAYREREDPRALEAMLRAGLAPGVDDVGRDVRVRAAFDWYVADHTREPPTPERRAVLEAVFLRDVVAPLTEATP